MRPMKSAFVLISNNILDESITGWIVKITKFELSDLTRGQKVLVPLATPR